MHPMRAPLFSRHARVVHTHLVAVSVYRFEDRRDKAKHVVGIADVAQDQGSAHVLLRLLHEAAHVAGDTGAGRESTRELKTNTQ